MSLEACLRIDEALNADDLTLGFLIAQPDLVPFIFLNCVFCFFENEIRVTGS
jgi:hypothetical protein